MLAMVTRTPDGDNRVPVDRLSIGWLSISRRRPAH